MEKPPIEKARLRRDGAFWNSFIIARRAESLIELYRLRCPEIVRILLWMARNCSTLTGVYERIASLDFSHHIAANPEERLAMMPVPGCGWNDLGTPTRLPQTLERFLSIVGAMSLRFGPREVT